MSGATTAEEVMDSSQPDLDALTTIIGALKRMSREEQNRTLQAVSVFLGLNSELPRPQTDASVATLLPRQLQAGDAGKSGNSFSEDRGASPKEFLRDKKPMSDVERVACLAYYLTVDISALNTEAAQPKFSNASMAVDNATKAGLLVQAIKGAKQLSASGEHYVQLLPDREAAREMIKTANVRRKTRRTAPKKGTPTPETTSSEQ